MQNLLQYPGIIGSTPDKSRLYAKGLHEGPAFTPDQKTVVKNALSQRLAKMEQFKQKMQQRKQQQSSGG